LLIPYFPELKPFAQGFLNNTLEAWTKGASWGYTARVDNNPHLLELIELAKRQGTPSTPEEALPFTEDLLRKIGFSTDFLPDKLTPETAKEVETYLLKILGEQTVATIRREERLIDSTLSGPIGPRNVLMHQASERTRQNVSASIRDAKHMHAFLENCNNIDLLQVDGKQEKKILSLKDEHPLWQYMMESRVFSAKTLQESIEKISLLI